MDNGRIGGVNVYILAKLGELRLWYTAIDNNQRLLMMINPQGSASVLISLISRDDPCDSLIRDPIVLINTLLWTARCAIVLVETMR